MIAFSALRRLSSELSALDLVGQPVTFSGKVSFIAEGMIRIVGIERRCSVGDHVIVDPFGVKARAIISQIDVDCCAAFLVDTNCGLRVDMEASLLGPHSIRPDDSWKGRIIDAFAGPMDQKGQLEAGSAMQPKCRGPLISRSRIDKGIKTGVRVIDVFTPICEGQRIGLFAGSGVGKSTLLSMLSNNSGFDNVVVALVGERGREVTEFVSDTLGEKGMAKTTLVAATGDQTPLKRSKAAETAATIASHFAASGKRVLFLIDSVTRYAHALREIAISLGEPPVARGYPATVFSRIPALLEQGGAFASGGSVTMICTVLVDGDDQNDPVADVVRGVLDGHVVLERSIAQSGRYPAVNILKSVSRLADRVWQPNERQLVRDLLRLISVYEDTADIRLLGGYTPGSDPEVDKAVSIVPAIYSYFSQSAGDHTGNAFTELASHLRNARQ